MPCYHPIAAYQDTQGGPVTLGPPLGTSNLELPCGKCLGCRQAHANQWALRCQHEAASWKRNTFLTLTYDDKHVPHDNTLQPAHLQLFLKRLRKHASGRKSYIDSNRTANIRFFACGEYGELKNRPHYHLLLFNCGFKDTHTVGKDLQESEILRDLWPHGGHRAADAQAGAVAGYIAKYNLKQSGRSPNYDADGVWRQPPFLRMSLRPAIGNEWLKRYATDLHGGYAVINGRQTKLPRYYRDRLDDYVHGLRDEAEAAASTYARNNRSDKSHPDRRADAERIHQQKARMDTREISQIPGNYRR